MSGPTLVQPGFQVGQRASFSKTLTEADISAYAGLVADFNPQHVDAEYARRSKFGQRTVHEMLVAALVSSVLSGKLPGQTAVTLSQQFEFLAPVFIGDTITAAVEVTAWQPEKRLITLKTECLNQDGRQVLTGQAVMMVQYSGD
jgi:3-hydroxybutyryl-CoA dehydratase